MTEVEEKEDRLIRRILIAGSAFALLGFLATVVMVAVLVSYNFNFLNWLE